MPPPMGHYSQAVQVGNLLFIAGQPDIDLSGSADPDTALGGADVLAAEVDSREFGCLSHTLAHPTTVATLAARVKRLHCWAGYRPRMSATAAPA